MLRSGKGWTGTDMAGGRCPRPGAISLTQPDAGSLEVISLLTTNTAGCIIVIVAHILDEETILRRI